MKQASTSTRRHWLLGTGLACMLALNACTTAPVQPPPPSVGFWSGRLAVQVQSTHALDAQNQSFSASFELQGSAATGRLQLFTPLGSSVALITWDAAGATVEQSGQQRTSASLDELVQDSLGATIPIAALFQWLQGQATEPEGWQVDVTRHAEGRISAQRYAPLPQAQLRIVLDR